MEISGLQQVNTTGAQTSVPGSDFQTFLRMLTVQMQNQDPLNPMNASDFAVQLATFSGVEQQTYTNQLLSSLLTRTGLADLGAWVGMDARIFGGAWFDGNAVALEPDPTLGADAATLIVRNASGAIVDSRALPPIAQSYAWDGQTGSGTRLPEGRYSFELQSSTGGEVIDTQPVASYQRILEARQEDGGTIVVLPGGLYAESSTISGLRRPAG